jgi:hypothetical protein
VVIVSNQSVVYPVASFATNRQWGSEADLTSEIISRALAGPWRDGLTGLRVENLWLLVRVVSQNGACPRHSFLLCSNVATVLPLSRTV